MNHSKPWYLSRTIWAAIVTIGVAVFGLFGHGVDGNDQSALVDALMQCAAAVAGVTALFGRLGATKRIE